MIGVLAISGAVSCSAGATRSTNPIEINLVDGTAPIVSTSETISDRSDVHYFRLLPFRLEHWREGKFARPLTECMREKGYNYDWPQPSPLADPVPRPYGIVDARLAASTGYHPAPPDALDSSDVPTDEGFLAALTGTSVGPTVDVRASNGEVAASYQFPGGCYGTAALSVFGSRDGYGHYQELLIRLNLAADDVDRALAADDGFRVVNLDWARCMAGNGFEGYLTPMDPMNFDWRRTQSVPSKRELAVAGRDVQCKVAVKYVERADLIASSYYHRIAESNPSLSSEAETILNS